MSHPAFSSVTDGKPLEASLFVPVMSVTETISLDAQSARVPVCHCVCVCVCVCVCGVGNCLRFNLKMQYFYT